MKGWKIAAAFAAAVCVIVIAFQGARLWGATPESKMGPLIGAAPPGAAGQSVALRGRIDHRMTALVIRAVQDGRKQFTIDSSLGGAVLDAYIMAAMLRATGGSLTVIGTCYSACALLLIGVEHRFYTSEADIRIHGARYSRAVGGHDDDAPARGAAAYMVANGVPEDIAFGPGMGINLHRLTTEELARMGIVLLTGTGNPAM